MTYREGLIRLIDRELNRYDFPVDFDGVEYVELVAGWARALSGLELAELTKAFAHFRSVRPDPHYPCPGEVRTMAMNSYRETADIEDRQKPIILRIATLLSHYRKFDWLNAGLLFRMLRDYDAVLSGLDSAAVEAACVRYLTENPDLAPTPGAIFQLAVGLA